MGYGVWGMGYGGKSHLGLPPLQGALALVQLPDTCRPVAAGRGHCV